MPPDVCVVIPFYQRSPGILRKALDSIAGQATRAVIHTVIVDDSSPVSPADEVAASRLPGTSVTIIRQDNAGPGAARNRGLDAVPTGTRFVAFLDSDDAWLPNHVANALAALGDDLDFYIANYREPDSEGDEFTTQGKIRLAEHTRLDRGRNCYRFDRDMLNQVIVSNVIETSTVVFRHERLGALRFRRDFRNAFEDHLFWIAAAEASRGFAFSMDVEVQYGRGVSIWRSTGLGNDRLLALLTDQRRYYTEVSQRYAKTADERALVKTKLREVRHSVVADLLHRLRRRMRINGASLGRYLRLDPAMCLLALPIALRIALRRGTH